MKIIRFNRDSANEVIKTGLTLEEAQEHCRREDTHGEGWFDGYEDEDVDRDFIEEEKQELVLREGVKMVNRFFC